MLAALLALAAGATPQREPLDAGLLRRIGSTAALVHSAQDSASWELLRAGLRDPNPAVRGAAARVVLAAGVRPVLPELRAALASELDPDAAGEQARALATLEPGEAADGALLAAAGRLAGAGRPSQVLSGIGAARGDAALRLWPELKRLSLRSQDWAAFFRGFEARGWAGLEVFADPVLAEVPDAVASYLGCLADARQSLTPEALSKGLRSESAAVRIASLWHALSSGTAVSATLLVQLPPPADATEALPRAMLHRKLGGPTTDLTPLIREFAKEHARRGRPAGSWHALAALSAAERKELNHALFGKAGQLPKEAFEERRRRSATALPARTIGPLPEGYAAGVLAATGCRADERSSHFLVARSTFRPDGRLASIGFSHTPASPECLAAGRTLAMSTLGARRPGADELLFVPLHSSFLQCLAEPTADPLRSRGDHGRPVASLEEPKKTRNIPPIYPEAPKQKGVQGAVVLQTVVSRSGCIGSLEVLQGVHPELDLEAMRAVSQWRYTPTLLEGDPVPVYMTVTINFRLR